MENYQDALDIFLAAVEAVLPENLIKKNIMVRDGCLTCRDICIHLADFENIYLAGFGKASAHMARTMEELLGDRLTGGHILTKYHHSVKLERCSTTEAGHPIPDQNGIDGSRQISKLAENATSKDLILLLISGGGSSLLTDLPENIQLTELALLNKMLVQSGANIQEINSVRKHLSHLKGGQLARLAYPATVLALMISDVIGDPLDVIASGPTVADPTTFAMALQVLQKYALQATVPPSVLEHLEKGRVGLLPETVKSGDICLEGIKNILLGNNEVALDQAKTKATALGYETIILPGNAEGEVATVADYLMRETNNNLERAKKHKIALIWGGEPTVHPTGRGTGGRNQHLALLMAEKLKGRSGITFLSAGTDGTDGPTDATGALCDGTTHQMALDLGLEPETMIANFDSYTFFAKTGGQLITGPTNTNVMDVIIVLLTPN